MGMARMKASKQVPQISWDVDGTAQLILARQQKVDSPGS